MYKNAGKKAYRTKESLMKQYTYSFSNNNDDGKRNSGKLKLDYQNFKTIDANNQLVMLEYMDKSKG